MSKKFTEYSQLNLSEVNKEVLKKWDENDVFSRSMTEREGHPSFVFYEGPPSANGMPGIHHVMARTIKDTFCRFKTMKGFQVKRKAGWDTHGLPTELKARKKAGVSNSTAISDIELRKLCREFALGYLDEQRNSFKRLGGIGAAEEAGGLLRLEPGPLHHGRGPLQGRPPRLRLPLQEGPHL